MALETGQHLLQLEEKALAGQVVVGEHGEFSGKRNEERGKLFRILSFQERGGGDGDGLVTGREHGPAVGAAFGDEERISRTEAVEHGQVVDTALRTLREAEAGQAAFY